MISVARPSSAIIARWREAVVPQLALGSLAMLALAALALRVRRGKRALAAANASLEERVEERTAALRDSEARLMLAQRAARIGSWVLEPGTGEVIWSAEQFALFGIEPGEGGRMTNARFFNEIVHPEDRPVVAAAWAAAAQTGEFDADFRVWRRTADGGREVRWMTGRARRLPAPTASRDASTA